MARKVTNAKLLLRPTLTLFLPACVLVILLATLVYQISTNSEITALRQREKYDLDTQVDLIRSELELVYSDVMILASHHELQTQLALHQPPDYALTSELMRFSEYRKCYDQVRILTDEGMEYVRVNLVEEKPVLVSREKLQDKANRYYFSESISLDRNEIYMSYFDLNIEADTIELPLKPMIRFGTPIFSQTGDKLGVAVLNYLGVNLLNNLKRDREFINSQSILLNRTGYYLKGLHFADEWGFMWDDSSGTTFATRFPQEWDSLHMYTHGQFITENGLFSFARIMLGSDEAVQEDSGALNVISDDVYWYLIAYAPAETLDAIRYKYKALIFPVTVILIFLLGIGSMQVSWMRETRLTSRIAQERQQIISTILENASFGVILLSIHNNQIIYANNAFEDVTGHKPDEFNTLGEWLRNCSADDELTDTILASIPEFIKSDKKYHDFDMQIGDDPNSQRTIVLRLNHMNEEQYIVVLTDITERRSLQDQLIQAQKMEAVGRLASGVSHDFNNLLTAIVFNAERSALDPDLPPKAKEAIDEILGTADRATKLTRQLLSFSRKKQTVVMIPIALRELIDGMSQMLHRLLTDNVKIDFVNHSPDDLVFADERSIEQILLNLVVNARDAMPEGGSIRVEIQKATPSGETCAACKNHIEGEYVTIKVSDTGQGIPAEVIPHIFEPFYTTKPEGQGTGLGLSTIYGILSRIKGHVTLTSEQGVGTTFTVYLPLYKSDGAESVADKIEHREEHFNPEGSSRILLIEDDDQVRVGIHEILTHHGYSVQSMHSGYEAIGYAMSAKRDIDLILTDLAMEEFSGSETIKALRQYLTEAKVLLMSGTNVDSLGEVAAEMEADGFVHKPISSGDLLRKIQEVLQG